MFWKEMQKECPDTLDGLISEGAYMYIQSNIFVSK